MLSTLEKTWPALIKDRNLVFATSKLETLERALERWKIQDAFLENPEQSGPHPTQEPKVEDPKQSALYKVSQVRQYFTLPPEHPARSKEPLMVGTDLVFSTRLPDGTRQFFHKPVRQPDQWQQFDQQRVQRELLQRYDKEQFSAIWDLAVGVADQKAIRLGTISIETNLSFLTRQEIEEYFLETSNAGVQMVELAIDRNANFQVRLTDEEQRMSDPIVCATPESKAVLRQLVADKLPTQEMIVTLLNADIQQHADRYGLVAFGLQDLFSDNEEVIQ